MTSLVGQTFWLGLKCRALAVWLHRLHGLASANLGAWNRPGKDKKLFFKVALHDIEWPPPNYSSFLLLSFPHKIFDKCFFAAKIMQLALSTSVLIWLSYPIRATIYWKVYKVDKNNTAHISRGNIFFISEFSCSLIDQNVLTFDSLLCRESKLTYISIKTGAKYYCPS